MSIQMCYRRLIILSALIFQTFLISCSDRLESPSEGKNSTEIYQSKSANGIEASIVFCEKIGKQTGELINSGTDFVTKENSKVYTIAQLTNRELNKDKVLMFHIDWLDSTGNSIFKKRIDLSPKDSSTTLVSSLNTSPERRQPGIYSVRVYLFRELIAEKKFELVTQLEPATTPSNKSIENIKADIALCKGLSKKDGSAIGLGTIFEIKDKAKVLAMIKLENTDSSNHLLTFYADWIGPNDSTFYRKKIEVSSNNNSFSSSISISPEKRQPGKYRLQILLFDKIIGEENFELIKAEKKEKRITKIKSRNFSAGVILCEKTSKKTGSPINPDSVFVLKEKGNLKAIIQIEKEDISSNQNISFLVEWTGPEKESFYKKKIELEAGDTLSTIISSISISPQKRQPGNYILRVYQSKELIGEKKFLLKETVDK